MDRQAVEYLLSENEKWRRRLESDIEGHRDEIQNMEEELAALEVEWDELNDKIKNNR